MANKILWNPQLSSFQNSNIYRFQKKINSKYNLTIDNYIDLHKWSIDNSNQFWEEVWNYAKKVMI